jgi:hypothetical protein
MFDKERIPMDRRERIQLIASAAAERRLQREAEAVEMLAEQSAERDRAQEHYAAANEIDSGLGAE